MTSLKNSISPLLGDGSNYLTWSAEIKLFLRSKNLFAFLDASPQIPLAGDADIQARVLFEQISAIYS